MYAMRRQSVPTLAQHRMRNRRTIDNRLIVFKHPSCIDRYTKGTSRVTKVNKTFDTILAGPNQDEINDIIDQIRKAKLDITVEGDIQDFLGVNISKYAKVIYLDMRFVQKSLALSLRLWSRNSNSAKGGTLRLPFSLQTTRFHHDSSSSSSCNKRMSNDAASSRIAASSSDNNPTTTSDTTIMHPPPPMSLWNGALRLGLEMASLLGLGHFAYATTTAAKPLAAIVVPTIAAAAWGTFNVPADPSRGGGAPIVVSGRTRLVVEVVVLGSGGLALWHWNAVAGGVFFAATAVHYVSYHERIQWLLQRR